MTQPETLPLAKIEPCPNPECGKECSIEIGHHAGYWVMCRECEYCGPIVVPAMAIGIDGANAIRAGIHEAIRLHNLICSRDKPEAEAARHKSWCKSQLPEDQLRMSEDGTFLHAPCDCGARHTFSLAKKDVEEAAHEISALTNKKQRSYNGGYATPKEIDAIIRKHSTPPLPSYKLRGLVRAVEKMLDFYRNADDALPPSMRQVEKALQESVSQEPSSGEAQKPVAWIRGVKSFVDGSGHYGWDYDEQMHAGSERPSGENWVPLFASPVTDGGGDVEKMARAAAEEIWTQSNKSNNFRPPTPLNPSEIATIIRRHMGKL